jgi:hypothetical protein
MRERLACRPVTLRVANRFVGIEHRHLGKVPGCKFALGAWSGDKMVGVATARLLNDPLRAEITRLATDGTFNACSFLYSRSKRVVQAMGFTSLKTYTRTDESGASLRAICACCEAELKARSWAKSNKKRKRTDRSVPAPRYRWELLPKAAA